MKELVEKLKSCKGICCGGKANVRHNIDARKFLADEGFAVFPDEFFSLVKYANGIISDFAKVYAIEPYENNGFTDAVWANDHLARADRSQIAVLGEDMFDFLVYDAKNKEYQMRDRNDDEVMHCFSKLDDALCSLFKI